MPTRSPLFVLLVLISAVPAQPGAERNNSEQLKFVRQFSSAQDVRGPSHAILNKTVDILAGPRQEKPAAPSELQEPYAVATDSTHRIFVTDMKGFVHVFDFIHGEYSHLQGADLRSPAGIATDPYDNVYVSDSSLRTILIYSPKGKFIRYLKKLKGNEAYFAEPRGIALDAGSGNIYVCDTTRHMVIMLDKEGHVLATFGKRGGGTAPGEFRFPTEIVAIADELFVLDSGNARIQILDLRGHFRKEITVFDATHSVGLAVRKDKNIYVSDPELNRLQVLNYDGQLLYTVGYTGSGVAEFNKISGIWLDSEHCLYVVDTKNKRVELFNTGGSSAGSCLGAEAK
jgi:DNA-binding beta-propeller fold protein YncE